MSQPKTAVPKKSGLLPIQGKSGRFYLKGTAWMLMLTFLTTQAGWAADFQPLEIQPSVLMKTAEPQTLVPSSASSNGNAGQITSTDFLGDTLGLTKVSSGNEAPVLNTDSPYFKNIFTNGMNAYWNFDAAGTSVSDLSGKGNTGALINGPVFTPDPPAVQEANPGSLRFDGINDYVEIPASPSLNLTGEITLTGWIKLSATGKDQKILGNQTGNGGGYKLSVYSDNRLEFEVRDAANNYYLNRWVNGGTSLVAGKWYQVTAVYSDSGNYIRTYIDGVLDRELITQGVLGASSGSLKIGREPFSNAWFFAGAMDELRIYNRALADSEIRSLAAGQKPVEIPVITTNSLTVSYTVDGVQKTKTFSNLTAGENELRIEEINALGKPSVLVGRVRVEIPPVVVPPALPPSPSVNSPKAFINTSSFTLSGTKAANTSVWINGAEKVAASAATTWTATVSLPGEGLHSFSILAKNSAGLESQAVPISTTLDTKPPEIIFTSSALSKNSNYILSYTVEGQGKSVPRTLVTEGNNILSITETDAAGNQITQSFTVKLDTTPPAIVMISPKPSEAGISKEGIAGFWNFEEGAALGVGDQSENKKNGSLKNGTLWSSDHPNLQYADKTSLKLDGYDDFVEIPGNGSLNITGEVTVAAWIKLEGSGRDQKILGNENNATGGFKLGIYSDNRVEFEIRDANNQYYLNRWVGGGTALAAGVWYHVTGVYSDSGNSIRTYINGKLDRELSTPGVLGPSAGALILGKEPFAPSGFFKGGMDEVQIFRRVLTSKEIEALAQGKNLGSSEPPVVSSKTVTVNYTVDGAAKTKTFFNLSAGENDLKIVERDDVGNESTLSFKIKVEMPVNFTVTLSDQTQLITENNRLVKEIAPDQTQIFYDADQSVTKFRSLSGEEIQYDPSGKILITSAQGQILETLGRPVPTSLDETKTLKLSLAGGIEAYYLDGKPVEFRTSSGIRVTDFTLSPSGDILDALLVYPDGTLEIIRRGTLLRKISSDGTVLDFTPKGFRVREITSLATQYYRYEKISQTQFSSLEIFTQGGALSHYDEFGILREAKDSSGKRFVYERQIKGSGYKTFLNTASSTLPSSETLVEGYYSETGKIEKLVLKNGRQILFLDGMLHQVLEADGKKVDYSYQESQGILAGLQVTRGKEIFQYDQNGFLKSLQTSQGTIQRVQKDTSGDGKITEEDLIIILLETVGGDTLSDFELDSQGKILNGLLKTKEGIQQRIEKGVLTGFETAEGKNYDLKTIPGTSQKEAVLREWQLRDGTRVLYGGGQVSEVVFPDGKRLHTLGWDRQKQMETYTETLPDGTQKFFRKSKLIRLITPEKAEIHYDTQGDAERILLPDGAEEKISYTRNESGELQEIVVTGDKSRYAFYSDGTLKQVLEQGVQAAVENQEIQKLFTRFGEIVSPEWDANGILSGEIHYQDGSIQKIQNGELIEGTLPDGKKIRYENGRIQSIETSKAFYEILYQEAEINLKEVRLRIRSSDGVAEYPLIPYLENPEIFKQENYFSHSIHFEGNAQAHSLQKKFGTGSLKLDGAGDYLQIADGGSQDFQYGSEDFTIDTWMRLEDLGRDQKIWSQYTGGVLNHNMSLQVDSAGRLTAHLEKSGQSWAVIQGAKALEKERWYHVALVRNQNTIKIFLDGKLEGSAGVTGDAPSGNFSMNFGAGASGSGMSGFFKGALDELRVSKGIARWTENFIPPTGIYQKDVHTKLLFHFNDLASERLLSEESQIASLLLPRPLRDSLENRYAIQSEVDTGDGVFFAKLVPDSERETVYQFGGTLLPDWGTLNLSGTYNPGFLMDLKKFGSTETLASKTATILDMNGDGFADRVWIPGLNQNYWWVQLNNGLGFDPAIAWQGVDPNYYQSLLHKFDGQNPYQLNELIDINGDKRPDRVFQKNPGEREWYVQLNTGAGFEAVKLWEGNNHPLLTSADRATYALEARNDTASAMVQEKLSDLIDMDGDGLPDRVIRPLTPPFTQWFFQKNLGNGFADAVLWKGIDISSESDPKIAGSLSWNATAPGYHPLANELNGVKTFLAEEMERIRLATPKGLTPSTEIPASVISRVNEVCARYGASDWAYFITRAREVPNFNARIDNVRSTFASQVADSSLLIDMNGDARPDRLFLKAQSSDAKGRQGWYVQWNNGTGFDIPAFWESEVRAVPGSYNEKFATSLRVFNSWESPRNLVVDLRDVTGDGRPDRISLPKFDDGSIQNSWWVEKNNGKGFDPAVLWSGIEGRNANETAISQEDQTFRSWSYGMSSPGNVRKVSDLIDMNGDKILDRVLYQGGTAWRVQLGTGSGFLPSREMAIEAIKSSTQQISTSHYDYLHVSLKSAEFLSSAKGKVRVTLSGSHQVQTWEVTDLNTLWQDFYLPLDPAKPNGTEIKIEFVPAAAGSAKPAIYVDNMTFAAFRPPAVKDWLDRFLAEEEGLKDIDLIKTKTISDLLGIKISKEANPLDWESILKAETRIAFDGAGEAVEFETLYGSVSKIDQGKVVETLLPDGSKIEFSLDASHPHSVSQTVTQADGSLQNLNLNYGRIRTLARPGKSALQYSYEFNSQGEEITVVKDSDSGITERYRENQLISRTQSNGVMTSFYYHENGELASSSLSYKGRVHHTFAYETNTAGHRLVRTEQGVLEEYGQDGKIVAHTTPEGYRYVHTFERAKKAVTIFETKAVTLPDGTLFQVNVPTVILQEDPQGEQIHRVSLSRSVSASGEKIQYEEGQLKGMELDDSSRISFNRFEIVENLDRETGEVQREIRLLDAVIFHADGTVTEFKDGIPFSVTSAAGRVISLALDRGNLINENESAAFHQAQAGKLWKDLVLTKWNQFQAPVTLPIQMEYTLDGKMVSREFAEGMIELYEEGRIQEMIAPDGERLIQYQYDSEGNPIRIELGGARRRLEASTARLKAEIAVEREKALAKVADREQVLSQTIEGQYVIARDKLLALRAQIENEQNNLANLSVKGKKAKNVLGDALQSIQVGLSQVNGALEQLAQNRSDALKQLSAQVLQVSNQIEAQTRDAYGQIETENQKSRKSILQQEISPIVYHGYRKILGRDPSQAEYEALLNSVSYDTGIFDVEGLRASLLQSSEFIQRTAQVEAIKKGVTDELLQYLTWSQDTQLAFAQSLGILPSEWVDLSTSEVNAILHWIKNGSLHFGQSAYLALEALLADSGISFERVGLAKRLILTDILSGVLTPLEEGDLVISVYALKRVAAHYGLNTDGFKVTYSVLKQTYDHACAENGIVPCAFRLVAHINGNHFIVITKVTDSEVTYIDSGAGPENAQDVRVVSKDAFLATWVSSLTLKGEGGTSVSANATGMIPEGFGIIFSARGPPAATSLTEYKKLTAPEQMQVRGAFFPLLVFVVIAIANAVVAAVTATIAAITAIISGLVAGISAFIGGVGSFFGGIFTGNLFGALQGLFSGILNGLVNIGSGLLHGVLKFASTFTHAFSALQTGTITPLQSLSAATGLFGSGLTGSAVVNSSILISAFGFGLEAGGTLLDFVGVSPKITQTLIAGGKIAAGVGLLATGNPLGVAASIGLATSGTADMLNLHTTLSPTLNHILGLSSSALAAFTGGGFSGLKSALPYLSMNLASAGLISIGNAIGLDWRLTALISVPVSASIGNFVSSLGYANGINPTSIFAAIKNGLAAGAASIGFDFGGAASHTLFGSLGSGTVLKSIESSFGGDGLFSSILNVLGKALLSPFNAIDSVVRSILSGVQNFLDIIQQKGIAGAFESLATSIFSRKTIESLFGQGGVSGVISAAAKVLTTLNGQSVQEQKLSSTTSIFYDPLGNFIGKKEDGITQLGTFGVDKLGKWGLLAGQLFANFLGDLAFAGTIENGQLYQATISGPNGNLAEIRPEDGEGPIEIRGPDGESSGGSFRNAIIKYLPFLAELVFDKGRLKSANVQLPSAPSQNPPATTISTKPFFMLANGINNEENCSRVALGSVVATPVACYYADLEQDLIHSSNGQVLPSDVVIPSIYPNILRNLIQGLRTGTNRTIDVLKVIAEGQTSQWHFGVVKSLQNGFDEFYKSRRQIGEDASQRSLVGVGYSGGMAPLLEAIASKNILTAAIIGAGAALADITEIRETLENVINALEYVQTNIFSPVKGILSFVFGNTIGKLPYIGNGIQNTLEEFLAEIDTIVSVAATPTAVITDLLGKFIEEAVGRSLEALKIQGKLRDLDWLGLSNINTPGAVMVNVYGDNDVLNKLNVGGYRDQIANFSTSGADPNLINIEVMSYANVAGDKATADHYIYFGHTRNYDEIKDAGDKAAQMDFDTKVNDFMTRLTLASQTAAGLNAFITENGSFLTPYGTNSYRYYPYGAS